MANSVDPDQTAPIGAVCSGSKLFAFMLNSSVMLGAIILRQLFAADDFIRQYFQMHFFLGALKIKSKLFYATKKLILCNKKYALNRFHIGLAFALL